MRKNNYNNFINEMNEKPKREKKLMKLYISPELEKILKNILKTGDFQAKTISNKILNVNNEPEDNLYDISYLDIDRENEDMISFMPAQRAWFVFGFNDQEEANQKPEPDSEVWKAKGRQSLGVGKLINKLFDNFTDISVDKFVKTYRAEISALTIYDRLKLVRGEDIRFWYADANYDKEHGNNVLTQSCMRYDGGERNCQGYLNIYVENPEKCSMLILTNKNNKLMGRALVWSGLRKPTDKIFMDRIYTVKQSDVELFKKYAKQNGWLYKYNQDAYDASYMEEDNRINKSISLALKPKEYKYYPYMDTLKYYNPKTGRLASDPGNPVEGTRRCKLESPSGGHTKID